MEIVSALFFFLGIYVAIRLLFIGISLLLMAIKNSRFLAEYHDSVFVDVLGKRPYFDGTGMIKIMIGPEEIWLLATKEQYAACIVKQPMPISYRTRRISRENFDHKIDYNPSPFAGLAIPITQEEREEDRSNVIPLLGRGKRR